MSSTGITAADIYRECLTLSQKQGIDPPPDPGKGMGSWHQWAHANDDVVKEARKRLRSGST